ncbi:hypothetical protein TCSYLVIO_009837 [Trypanosoma cruzi]|nr:hypothetical protein TCSYLVIO_009837 [Trypanosoma cruzi]
MRKRNTIGTVMNRGHNKKTIHTVFDAHHMHEDRRNDGEWMSSTQHSVGERQQQQQRGARGGFAHAYRSPRSHTCGTAVTAHTLREDVGTYTLKEAQIIHTTTAMHRGNRTHNRKQCNLHALWKISAMRVSQKSAVTLPFILHSSFTYHWEARSHYSSVPLPVLLVSLHWRKLSPHIPITVHCGTQINHTAWVRCRPANKSQEPPHCLVWHGRQSHYACERLFSKQERGRTTRP